MLIRIVSILFPLFAITALGYFVGRRMKPDLSHANKLNMDVFVPALVFGALVSKDFRLGEYLPLLFATGPGSEIQRPLAIVVIGGLITSTLLTLILLPILFERFGESAGETDNG